MKYTFKFWSWNRWAGLAVALLSFLLYLRTLEPTVSFWDCGEFLSCATRLEVCHAPGAPLFILTGRLAAMLAGSDPHRIAFFVNSVSALASGFTIAFLFWSITWSGRKLFAATWVKSTRQQICIIIAGVVGSLSFAFSDSFWFSAVESEVYAMSSLFTAAVFWCILKWEESAAENKYPSRWLLLIAYLTGLSIGVHLLNLLTIPAITMVYYFKNYTVTLRNTLFAFLIGIALLAGFLFVFIPGIPAIFSWLELFLVNSLHCHLNTGYYVGIILVTCLSAFGLHYFKNRNCVRLYNGLVFSLFLMAGYSVYGVVVLRAHDNPPINMTAPDNPFALRNYLNREQYVQPPLLYGPSFNSVMTGTRDRNSYQPYHEKYITNPLIPEYIYDQQTLMLFPRMWSSSPDHKELYKQWSYFKGRAYAGANGQEEGPVKLPSFGENLRFFFRYQLGFMYFRYFMWNFSGRQNDIQGHGNCMYGNWITGIPFADRLLTVTGTSLPSSLKNNPGRNRYFMLPLLLGLAGMWFQYKYDRRNFGIVAMLFVFTGIAIVVFLNEIPSTPRERDYAYAGSFYVFGIWIGLGALGLLRYAGSLKMKTSISAMVVVLVLAIPALMLWQNFDDHNRSNRFVVREYARNYLESCAPNAILFTNADNDTYPLWYAQEVEGIRKDVRIVLAPYLSADWYVGQMRKSQGKNKGLKMSLGEDKYIEGRRSYLPVNERVDSSVELSSFLAFAGSEDPRTKLNLSNGESVNYVPSRKLHLTVGKQDQARFDYLHLPGQDSLEIRIKGNAIRMDQLVLMDILESNRWERPVYFASAQVPLELGLEQYLQLDGYAFRLVPCKKILKDSRDIGIIDADSLYRKYMHMFEWKSLSDPSVYLDWTHMTTLHILDLRDKFSRLAEVLIAENNNSKAVEVLDKVMEILPAQRIGNDYNLLRVADAYLKAGAREKGGKLLARIIAMQKDYCAYFDSVPPKKWSGINYEIRLSAFLLQESIRVAEEYKLQSVYEDTSRYWSEEEVRLRGMLE